MKILLATDGSKFGMEATRACADIAAKEQDAVVRIISVVEQLTPDEPFDTESDYFKAVQKAAMEAALDNVEVARRILISDPRNKTLRVETKAAAGKPGALIITEAEKWGADLIILGSHGHGFWARTLLGSISDAVVNHAPCSVLIVRKTSPREG